MFSTESKIKYSLQETETRSRPNPKTKTENAMDSRAHSQAHFQKTIIASLIGAAFLPGGVFAALDFAQAPPGTVEPYVAPNVILSLDDSTSMEAKDMVKVNNKWTKTRTEVLKDALISVFSDKTLLPDGKIRLAWQSFGMTGNWANCTPGSRTTYKKLDATAASTGYVNTMRPLEGQHRENFLNYANAYQSCSSTPTHWMVKQADEYMRAPLHKNGPWADKPGTQLASEKNGNKPLGCRRNYHILLTDGDWNGTYSKSNPINTDPINFDNQDSSTHYSGAPKNNSDNRPIKKYTPFKLPDGTEYRRDDPNTWVYRDIDFPTWSSWHGNADSGYNDQYISTLADWTFKSWATELQSPTSLSGQVSPLPEYEKAPPTEIFTNKKTGKTATLSKYWNPRYNPATWPHMVTFTIGFSNDSIPKRQFRPMGKTAAEVQGNIGRYWIDSNITNSYPKRKNDPLWNWDGPFTAGGNNNSNNGNSDPVTDNGNNGLLIQPTNTIPYGYDGSFADYAAGRAQWYSVKGGEAAQDMWHAAINGRGQFYAVEKGEDLKKAFEQIVRTINAETEPDRGSTATSGSNASQDDVGIFTASYVPKEGWRGSVSSEIFKSDDGSTETAWDGKTTADKLDDPSLNLSNRLILTWNDAIPPNQTAPTGGVSFKWNNLNPTQKNLLTATGADAGPSGAIGADGQKRLNYLRGDRSLECPSDGCTTSKPFRERWSRQGSIINSEVWYVGAPVSNYPLAGYTKFTRKFSNREPMLYVGGNDGMLHGFTAADGTERIAYIPRGIISDLPKLTNKNFNDNHRYFVDGSPMTGDVFYEGNTEAEDGWKTLLIGTLGAGGRGYFVLDVTNPSKDQNSTNSFTEANAANLVVMDKTFPASTTSVGDDDIDDLGHIFAKPVRDDANHQRTTQIVRLNNNRWAAVMGNGYNSANARPVLLIQYLDGAKELLRIPAVSTDSNNGLSAPRLVDISGDGRPDVVYAGDLKGNLWKFLINTENDSEWGVATWEGKPAGTPLFTANRGIGHSANTRNSTEQAITAAPSVRVNDRMKITSQNGEDVTVPVGGMMVAFGTGRNITKLDQAELQRQTLYSVLDNTRYELEMTGSGPNSKPTGRVKVCTSAAGACSNLVKGNDDLPQAVAQSELESRTIPHATAHTRDGRQFWKLNSGDLDWSTKKGWFLDFPLTRERLLKPMEFYDGSNLLVVSSQIPAKGSRLDPSIESCEGGAVDKEEQYVTFINIMDGKAPSVPIIDGPPGLARYDMPPGALTMISKNNRIHVRGRKPKAGGGGTEVVEEKMRRMPEISLRPSWRQLK